MEEEPRDIPFSPLQIEQLCRRVGKDDVAQVTPADVDRVLRHATAEQLRAAMRVLMENNKFGDVAQSSSPAVFDRAVSGVDASFVEETGSRIASSHPTQASVLQFMTESIRASCSATLQRLRRTVKAEAVAETTEGT
jgi:hypothetical protein